MNKIHEAVGNLFSYGRVDDDAFAEPAADVGETFIERAKYIPLRLSYDERKQLHLLEASLSVRQVEKYCLCFRNWSNGSMIPVFVVDTQTS
jgi:hypothetical protein